MTQIKHCSFLLPALLIALSFCAAGYFIADGLRTFRQADNFVTVKGLAERNVEADIVIWPIKHSATGDDITAVQNKIEKQSAEIKTYIKKHGLSPEDITGQKITMTDLLAQQYRGNNANQSRYIISETITIRTQNMNAVESSIADMGELIRKGVTLNQQQDPAYVFTGLNEIKPAMIAEATKNARASAAQFAKDSGTSVGGIREANQGVFQILPRNSANSYNEAAERQKKVRVVSTLKFYLKD